MASENKVKQTSELVWEEPPARRSGRAASPEHQRIADQLKSNPGKSARVATGVKNDGLATQIRKSSAVAFRDGVYTARAQRQPDGTFNIWATYVGPRED